VKDPSLTATAASMLSLELVLKARKQNRPKDINKNNVNSFRLLICYEKMHVFSFQKITLLQTG